MVGFVEAVVSVEVASGGGMPKILRAPSFMVQWLKVERAIPCPMPRAVAIPALWRSVAGMSKVIWGKTIIAPALHLAPEESITHWLVLGPMRALNGLNL